MTLRLTRWPFKSVYNFLKTNILNDSCPSRPVGSSVRVISERHINAPLDGTQSKTKQNVRKRKPKLCIK